MFNKKILSLLMLVGLMNISLQARQQDADMVSYKDYVEKPNHKAKKEYKEKTEKKEKKEIENKVKVSNNLPGHLQKGQIAKESFLNKGTMINTNKYENIKNTDIYRVDNRIFRISRNTNEILDVLK